MDTRRTDGLMDNLKTQCCQPAIVRGDCFYSYSVFTILRGCELADNILNQPNQYLPVYYINETIHQQKFT